MCFCLDYVWGYWVEVFPRTSKSINAFAVNRTNMYYCCTSMYVKDVLCHECTKMHISHFIHQARAFVFHCLDKIIYLSKIARLCVVNTFYIPISNQHANCFIYGIQKLRALRIPIQASRTELADLTMYECNESRMTLHIHQYFRINSRRISYQPQGRTAILRHIF